MANKIETTTELFLEAGRMMKKKLITVEDGVSFTQAEVLRFVHEQGKPLMSDIAKHLEISAPSATALVQQLARRGYLSREGNPSDRRQVHLAVTKKAISELTAIMNKRKKILHVLLEGLSEKDHQDMQRILQKMLKNK